MIKKVVSASIVVLMAMSMSTIVGTSNIKKSMKTIVMCYNKHGASKNANVKYSKKGIVKYKSGTFYTTSFGKTVATVYETNKKTKAKKSLGKVTFKVKKVNNASVLNYNYGYFSSGFIDGKNMDPDVNRTYNLGTVVKDMLINNDFSPSKFKSSEYIISFKSSDKSVASVSYKGKVTAKKTGKANIKNTVTFADKSKFSCKVKIVVSKFSAFEQLRAFVTGTNGYTVAKLTDSDYYYLITQQGDADPYIYYSFYQITSDSVINVGTLKAGYAELYINYETAKLNVYAGTSGNFYFGPVLYNDGNMTVDKINDYDLNDYEKITLTKPTNYSLLSSFN